MSFPRYDEYRDSGVAWLGPIPSHWDVLALKRLASLKSGYGITSEAIHEDGEYPVLGGNGVRGFTNSYTHEGHFPVIGRQGALCGNINYGLGRFWASEHAVVVTPIVAANVLWLGEMLRAMNLNQYSISAAQPGLSVDVVGQLRTALPPIAEQNAIVVFLEREVQKLDELITEQLRLIELLSEKHQSIISHAVTKGLNPDAPMKHSGVDWIGAVPAHWRTLRNKTVFREVDERSTTGAGELLTVSHITGVTRRADKDVNMFLAESLQGYKRCSTGDLVINTMWAWMGALGCSPIGGLVSPSYNVYRVRDTTVLSTRYYEYLCRIPTHRVAMKAHSTGVWESRLRLYPDAFLNLRTVLPPVREQLSIADFLDDAVRDLEILTADTEQAIRLLQERRIALITAAITGKIDVRNLIDVEAVAA